MSRPERLFIHVAISVVLYLIAFKIGTMLHVSDWEMLPKILYTGVFGVILLSSFVLAEK